MISSKDYRVDKVDNHKVCANNDILATQALFVSQSKSTDYKLFHQLLEHSIGKL